MTLVLYHGTTPESAEAILRDGWKPNSSVAGANRGQSRYLYLSTHYEDALWFAEQKGCDTVLELHDVPIMALAVDPEDGTADALEEELNLPYGLPGKVVLRVPLAARHFMPARKPGLRP